jgi:hypothetical protein
VLLRDSVSSNGNPEDARIDIKTPNYLYTLKRGRANYAIYVGHLSGRPDLILVRARHELVVLSEAGQQIYRIEPLDEEVDPAQNRAFK